MRGHIKQRGLAVGPPEDEIFPQELAVTARGLKPQSVGTQRNARCEMGKWLSGVGSATEPRREDRPGEKPGERAAQQYGEWQQHEEPEGRVVMPEKQKHAGSARR